MVTEADQWRRLLRLPADHSPAEVCSRFEHLAVELAPLDLQDLPLYAMPLSSLPESFHAATRHSGGWFHPRTYWRVREHLPEDRGPGACVIIRDAADPAYVEQLVTAAQTVLLASGERVDTQELQECVAETVELDHLCGVLIHELAHVLIGLNDVREWSEIIAENEQTVAGVRREFDRMADRGAERTESASTPEEHDLHYTRCVVHLDYRLRRFGGVHSTRLYAAGERYNQRDYETCYAALADEPARCADKSFREILALPLPRAFAECAL